MNQRASSDGLPRFAFWTGGVIVVLFIIAAICASFVHNAAYVAQPENPFAPPFWAHGGSMTHPLGTDQLGRDLGARMLYRHPNLGRDRYRERLDRRGRRGRHRPDGRLRRRLAG